MKRPEESASALIDEKIKELGDWRGRTLAKVREIIHQADPEIVEEWKWVKPTKPGTPVWSRSGIICTGETYKKVVKMTFAKGAALEDPSVLFNSSLEGKEESRAGTVNAFFALPEVTSSRSMQMTNLPRLPALRSPASPTLTGIGAPVSVKPPNSPPA